ncbi:unnamed protein product [Brassica rapa subsp. trilocularis]
MLFLSLDKRWKRRYRFLWLRGGEIPVCGEFSSTEGFGLAGWKVVWILR